MHYFAIQPTEEEWTELKESGVKLDGFMEQITNARILSEESSISRKEIDNDLYNYVEECRENGWEIDKSITKESKKLRKCMEKNEEIAEANMLMFKQMRGDLIDDTVTPILRKCYLYGILVANKNLPFVKAVDQTTISISEATEYDYCLIAERAGILAEALLERYKAFTGSENLDVDLKAARKFAEHEGLRTRYVTDKLRWHGRGLPCVRQQQ